MLDRILNYSIMVALLAGAAAGNDAAVLLGAIWAFNLVIGE